jgi:hypothetical protein
VIAHHQKETKIMKKINTPPIFDVDELELLQDWFERIGGSAFCSVEHINWFIRQHYSELLRSGNFFPRSQCVPSKVGPDFGKAVIQIMQREAALLAESE